MIAAWMAYGLLVTLLLSGVALFLEMAGRRWRLPTRFGWWGAVAGTLGVPLAVWLLVRPGSTEGPGGAIGEITLIGGPGVVGRPSISSSDLVAFFRLVDPVLLAGWGVASMVVLVIGLISVIRLRRAERGWIESKMAGQPVRVSCDVGPAVVGFFRSRIVVPGWALEAPETLQELIVAHEVEHVRAGDSRLLLSAYVAILLLPWNLPLWWAVRRLKLAIEVDCDGRVLRRGADLHAYGTLLLEVGARRSSTTGFAVTALTEPTTFLEKRIQMMTTRNERWARTASLPALAVAAALLVLACSVDQPRSPGVTGPTAVEEVPAALPEMAQAPRFTPYDQKPELLDRAMAAALFQAHYPPLLRDAGIGGTAMLWAYVDERGQVLRSITNVSSGHPDLDAAAHAVMRQLRFEPARNRSEPVAVWMVLPITFAASAADAAAADPPRTPPPSPAAIAVTPPATPDQPARADTAVPAGERTGEGPRFTPYDVKPELSDRTGVAEALARRYPPMLRDAGIGGTVVLWVFIDAAGVVGNTRVAKSSGHDLLDEAARMVMSELTFTPASRRGDPVGVWLQLPVTFSAGQQPS
jgi:TonB family protein